AVGVELADGPLPLVALFLALGQDVFLGFFEAGEAVAAFEEIARAAGGYQVVRVLLATEGSRDYEVHGHDQAVFEAGGAMQAAVLALEMVPREDPHSLLAGERFDASDGVNDSFHWHGIPPGNVCL